MRNKGTVNTYLWLFFVAFLLIPLVFPYTWARAQEKAKGKSGPQPVYGGVYRRPLGNDPTTLDPALVGDTYGFTVAQQIFDGLVQYDETLNIVPAIARAWKGSRDGLTWTFYLRKGVRFHHGREVIAEDFVYSFTRILDPKTRSKAVEVFEKIKGAKEFREGRADRVEGLKALDRYTLRIELSEASAPFVSALAIGYAKVVPKEVVEELGERFGFNPIGTGPFKFVKWERNREIVLEANKDYYLGRPYLDRVIFRVFPGQLNEQVFAEFEKGGLEDSLIPAEDIKEKIEKFKYQLVQRPILGVRFLVLNNSIKPLDNRLVRQALNYAIDMIAIFRDVHKNRYVPAKTILPPGTYGYSPKLKGYPYNPKKAKELLARAGFPNGNGLPPIQVWSSVKSEAVLNEHEAFQRYLADIGVKVEFQYNTNWPSFRSMAYDGKFPVFRYGWVADVPDPNNFLYALFHSKSPNNLAHYRNPQVDNLLDRAKGEFDYMKRVELYRQVEQKIMEDAPFLPISYYTYGRIFQPYVKAVKVSALGDPYIPMREIWLEKSPKDS